MISVNNFEYINTRIRRRRAQMWEGEKLEHLLSAGTLGAIAQQLGLEGSGADHFKLEAALVRRQVDETAMIAGFLRGARRRFLDRLLLHYVKENLKVILRLWAKKRPQSEAEAMVVDLPGELSLDIGKFFAASSIEQFLGLIQDPFLAPLALRGLKEFKDTGTTFFIEMGLDAGHFMGLKEAGSGLGLADRSSVRPLLAAEMTGRDVLALLRARLNYGIELDRMRPFLAVLDDVQAEKLAQAESVEKARPVLALLLGAKVPQRAATIPELEVAVWSEIRRTAAAKFRFGLDDLASPVSYYYLKRIELANLISVIEGVRLGLSREEIRGSLLPRAGA